ncbi:DUF2303 family protein [Tessaracoccus sp. MC1627]|uniref:DUF2303 family protein n=1 Tax=Tessaracoccus sp. MC1627 TaxID=2760312 RepID=UPI0015FF8D38|nr:DUF2303 family protein [Tessaracoccus sp. MC1627]MBB1512006.1 DUF2303 family protein [Tessaracoccus sp. MC1627]
MTIDINTVIDNAQEAVQPHELEDGNLYAVRNADGGIVLLRTPGYDRAVTQLAAQTSPDQIRRSITVRDASSLIDYLDANTINGGEAVGTDHRHGVGRLELWADIDRRTIKAVLDGNDGHRVHTATLELRHSIEWTEWTSIDGKLVDQLAFAQFIEDHLSSIGAPDGAKLLEICQTLEARTKVDFKSSELLANGQRKFKYDETTEAKAGQKGDLTIPAELTLVLRPFQGSEPVAILARFRYRLDGGQLRLGIKLAEPSKALEVAFNQIVDEVQASVPVRVNHGVG